MRWTRRPTLHMHSRHVFGAIVELAFIVIACRGKNSTQWTVLTTHFYYKKERNLQYIVLLAHLWNKPNGTQQKVIRQRGAAYLLRHCFVCFVHWRERFFFFGWFCWIWMSTIVGPSPSFWDGQGATVSLPSVGSDLLATRRTSNGFYCYYYCLIAPLVSSWPGTNPITDPSHLSFFHSLSWLNPTKKRELWFHQKKVQNSWQYLNVCVSGKATGNWNWQKLARIVSPENCRFLIIFRTCRQLC